MKDAMGHGSDTRGIHSAQIVNLPNKGSAYAMMSDKTYRASMPIANYTGQVQDLLGMWSGTQKPAALSADETAQINAAYEKRQDWRALAHGIHDARHPGKPAGDAWSATPGGDRY